MPTLNIKHLNKADVLRVLYNRATPIGMGFLQYTQDEMTQEEAEDQLSRYSSPAGDDIDTALYDERNGQGAAESALSSLRRERS